MTDQERRVRDLLGLTRRLAELIGRETDLMAARRTAEAGAVLEEKALAAAAYAREMKEIARDPGLIARAPKPLLADLKRAAAALREVLKTQERRIAQLRRVSEGLIKAIADDVAARRAPAAGYTAAATYAAPAGKPSAQAIAHNSLV